jgi:hypothetical protein
MRARAKRIIRALLEAGVNPSTLEKLHKDGGLDYEALGLPDQRIATSLFGDGILSRRGRSIVLNSRGERVLRTIWGRGVYFEDFMAHWREFEKQSLGSPLAVSESDQPMAL